MWHVVGYIVIGIVILYMAAVIHLIVAEKQGYKAMEYWEENGPDIFAEVQSDPAAFIIGFIIWPVRLAQFASMIPDYYALYEHN